MLQSASKEGRSTITTHLLLELPTQPADLTFQRRPQAADRALRCGGHLQRLQQRQEAAQACSGWHRMLALDASFWLLNTELRTERPHRPTPEFLLSTNPFEPSFCPYYTLHHGP